MAGEQGLLDAIWEYPHDDVPRLIYADWLEEHGADEAARARAELIRVQVDLARLPGDDPRFDALEAREEGLLKAWQRTWWAAMPGGARRGHFHRGFPVGRLDHFRVEGLMRLSEERMRAAPLWGYYAAVTAPEFGDLMRWPYLSQLDFLGLRAPLPEGWADWLVAEQGPRNASALSFFECPMSEDDLGRLLDGWATRHLRALHLVARWGIGDEVAPLLADHPSLARTRTIDLCATGLTCVGLASLLKGPHLGQLVTLLLGPNSLGAKGLAALLAWPGMGRLRWLRLAGGGLDDDSVAGLVRCPAITNLRTLELSCNEIGLSGARALASSPYLERLRRLSLGGNPLGRSPEAVAVLKKRFRKRVEGLPGR